MKIESKKEINENKSISSISEYLKEEGKINIVQSEQEFFFNIQKSFLPCREKEQAEIYYYIKNG